MQKFSSLFFLCALALFVPSSAWASDLSGLERHIDMTWVMASSALVMFMQAGFLLLEAGMVRVKELH